MVTKVNTTTIIKDLQQVARDHPSTVDGLTVMAGAKRLEELMAEIERLWAVEARAWSAHGLMDNEAQSLESAARRLRERNQELHLALDPPVVK